MINSLLFTRIQKVASKAAKKDKKKVCTKNLFLNQAFKYLQVYWGRNLGERIFIRANMEIETVGAEELAEDTLYLITTEILSDIVREVKFKQF